MGLEKKRMSKRMPLRKKYKIKQKINEHNRKLRKAAKKNKDFVKHKLIAAAETRVPNSYPFKEEILQEVQIRKELKIEERKQQQKEARQQEQNKKRQLVANPDMYTYAASSAAKDLEYTRKDDHVAQLKSIYTAESKDKSMQAYVHEFKKVVESADVIIEVLDARDPLGCRCPDVENTIATKYPTKKVVLLLNKIDLVPRENVEKWMAYLRNSHPTVAFKASTQRKGKISQIGRKVNRATDSDLQGSESLGADALLQLLKHYAKTGSVKTSITVGVVGFPNVGKSSVINSLCRVRAAKVGATPGVTKTAQEIHLDKHVKLLDTPGIVFPKSNDVSDDLILRNVVKLEQVADPISPISVILQRCHKDLMLSIYQIPTFDDTNDFLRLVARKTGKLTKGAIPNLEAAAKMVLQDWTGGKIPFYTEPPQLSKDIHVAASIVGQFAPEFDMAQANVLRSLDSINRYAQLKALPIVSSGPLDIQMDADTNKTTRTEDSDSDEEMVTLVAPGNAVATNTPTGGIKYKSTPPKPEQTNTASKKQDLSDEADQFNPQTNKNMKKSQKKFKKVAKKKLMPVSEEDANADYSFATDFAGGDDIDVDEIDM